MDPQSPPGDKRGESGQFLVLGISIGLCLGQAFGHGPMGLVVGIFFGALADLAYWRTSLRSN